MIFKITILIFLCSPLIVLAQNNYQAQLVSPLDSTAVYYISKDKNIYSFPSEKIYLSWFDNFNPVQNIDSTELKNYKYKGSIKYKPQTYKNLNYILTDGTIVKQINGPGYFYIAHGKKRVFTTMNIFEANGFKYKNAIVADISNYPWGKTINSVEPDLLANSNFIIPITKNYDTDQDGLSDYDEQYLYYTDWENPDTDSDGVNDGLEIQNKQSPLSNKSLIQTDTDHDYLNDYFELQIGTDLMNADTDGDLYLDGTEVAASYNPLDSDSHAKSEKLIKVDLKTQNLKYYFDNKLLGDFPISSGIRGMETPTGEFKILDKVPSKNYGGTGYNFYFPNTKWNLHFYTGQYRFYIHGAYWHHNFGHPMSHGCVNVSYSDMEPLYWFAQIGTKVIIK